MENDDIKFVFFGTGDFAVKIIDYLNKNEFRPSLIITTPDKPKGRKLELQPSPVKVWSEKNNKLVLQPKKLTDIHELISTYYDLFIVADYGKIIPREILNIPKCGCLNVHPSLLPKFRGPSPIQSFILSDEKETGMTIILMDEEIDKGPVVAISNLKSQISNLNYKELSDKLAELGGKLLIETVPDWVAGKITSQEQNHSQATYTKKITKEDGLINLSDSPEIIERKIRAFTPWPGAYFFVEKNKKQMRIIVTDAELKDGKLIIKHIKPEGKNEMPLEDFLRGNKDLEEQIRLLIKTI